MLSAIRKKYGFVLRPGFSLCLLLLIAILCGYWEIRHHEFVSFDDTVYVAKNPHIRNGLTRDGIRWAFSLGQKDSTYWHPLTWLSHMLDFELYGPDPGMHHVMNLIFHIANSILLFVVLKRMTGEIWKSAFVAALFALHPINVESVAWASERKNVLSTCFWMLTMLAYAFYAEKRCVLRYALTFLLFALGLLAKPMLMTLPCVLLLLDFWPLGENAKSEIRNPKSETSNQQPATSTPISHLLSEKVPFFLLSIASVLISSFSLHRYENMIGGEAVPMGLRVSNALVSYVKYIAKMLWPENLAIYYPYPASIPLWQSAGAAYLLVCVSFVIFRAWRTLPFLAVGWLWYLGTLVPVSGLMQAGLWPEMADRWAYVPLVGVFIMVAWGIPELAGKRKWGKPALAACAVFVLLILTVLTRQQVGHWENSVTLYAHAVAATKNNPVAHNNLGVALSRQRRSAEAVRHYSEALRLRPDYSGAHSNLGLVLSDMGKATQAIRHLSEALRLNPRDASAHNNMGVALGEQERKDEALPYFSQALRLKPDYAEAHYNMARILAERGKTKEAIEHYRESLRLDPDNPDAHNNLGIILVREGKTEEAISHFEFALRINPRYAPAYNNLIRVMGARKKARGQTSEPGN